MSLFVFMCLSRSHGAQYDTLFSYARSLLHTLFEQATNDDILPLSKPIMLPDGSVTDKIVIAKGTPVAVNEEVLNRSKALWGEDAWDFRPERWLDGVPERAQEIAGSRHGPKVFVSPLVLL
jgi:cytochrome P450